MARTRQAILLSGLLLAASGTLLVSVGARGTTDRAAEARVLRASGREPLLGSEETPVGPTLAGATGAAPDSGAWAGLLPRLEAAQDLARLGPEGAAALRAAISDRQPAVRAVAALTLLASPDADERDLRSVEGSLLDGDLGVRFAAGLTLLQLDACDPIAFQMTPLETSFSGLAAMPGATDEDAVRAICLAIAADATGIAPRLFGAMPGLSAPATRVLRAMLADPEVRRPAMEMLGRSGAHGVEAVADLDPARFEDRGDKFCAAVALLHLGCRLDEALGVLAENPRDVSRIDLWADDWQPVLPLLRRSLSGDGPIPPESALRIVCALGPKAAECLPEILRLRGSAELTPLAFCALASLGPVAEPALPWLLVGSDDHGTRDLWRDDIPRTGPRLLEEFEYGPWLPFRCGSSPESSRPACRVDVIALRAAARIAPLHPGVVCTALARLDDPDPRVRETAALALSEAVASGYGCQAVCARLARDPAPQVRAAAATVLGFAAWRGCAEAAAALARELETGDAEHAARALAAAGDDEALARAMESRRSATRAWAAAALFDPQAARFRSPNTLAELSDVTDAAFPRPSRAVAVIEACAKDPDPRARLVAVHVIGTMPQYFPATWERTLASAESDPDVDLIAGMCARYWEKQSHPWEEPAEPRREPPPGLVEELVRDMRGDDRPTPVDLAVDAEATDDAVLAAIARDPGLLAFERWCAARALAKRR